MNGTRMRLLAILTLLVVFVAGGLVGAALEHGRHDGPLQQRGLRMERRGPPPLFAEGSPVARRLNLTEAQRDSIEKITTRDRVRADSVFGEVRRRMRNRFDSTMTRVDSVLTPEQRAEWQKIRQEMMERERREGGRRRRGPGGPGAPGRPGGPGQPGGPVLAPPPPPPADSGATAPAE